MRDKKIHNLIMRQNSEANAALWSRIEAELAEELSAPAQKKKQKHSPKFWKVFSACTSAAVVLILGLGLGIGLGLNRKPDVSQVTPPNIQLRYCSVADCEFGDGEYTLKQYAEVYNVELLYLDWYNETEDYDKSLYILKDGGEPVCFKEYFVDSDFNYINIYVTDNRTVMDFIPWFDAETGKETAINNITVYYHMAQKSNMNFEYKNYRYYIQLDFEDFDYLCQIAELMLSNI